MTVLAGVLLSFPFAAAVTAASAVESTTKHCLKFSATLE